MYTKEQILKIIEETQIHMNKTQSVFGKEIYQKRFKAMFEGYLTALCTVLELDENKTTNLIKGSKTDELKNS
jgi:hypothetical protein